MFRIIRITIAITIISLCCSSSAFAALVLKNEITGLKDPALKNALTRLDLGQKSYKDTLTKKNILDLFDKGPNEIQEAIKPYGYFKATVNKTLAHQGNTWTAHYYVNAGPPLHITGLNVQVTGPGKQNKAFQKLLANFPISQNDILNIDIYKKAKNSLLTVAQKQGYLRAALTKDIIFVHTQNYTCTMQIILDTGPRFYFGPVNFSKTPLANSFLRRYIPFKQGQPFSFDKITDLQQTLSGGGYFSSVAVLPQQDKAVKQQVPVNVGLTMRKNKEYKFGIGYGTASGIRGTFGFQWLWLNQWGHKLNANFKLSMIEQNVAAQYIIPGKSPAHEYYTITGGVYNLNPDNGESFMKSIGVGYVRNYTSWQRVIVLDYQHETYKLTDISDYRNARMLVPGINYSITKADQVINTKKGNKFTIRFRGATTYALSTTDFIQGELQDKLIYTIFDDNRFVLRGDLGYTITNDTNKLPLSKQFYAGGMQTIRGFKYDSIGPGRYLILGSAEYQRRIVGSFYAAIFYDTGNATNDFDLPFARSTGVGVVWQSPIGAVQVYIAKAISKKNKPLRLEFSLGPDL